VERKKEERRGCSLLIAIVYQDEGDGAAVKIPFVDLV
jgi:hypothetical protein